MNKKIVGILVTTLLIVIATVPVMGVIDKPVVSKNEYFVLESSSSPLIGLNKFEEESTCLTASAEVYTNKFLYKIGEPIDITFLNTGTSTLSLGGSPWYQMWRFHFIGGVGWEKLYPDLVHPILLFVQAGKSMTDIWDQEDSDGNQVPIGFYRIDVPCSGNGNQLTVSDYFLILLPP